VHLIIRSPYLPELAAEDILRANGIAPSPPPLKRKASVEVERDATPVDDDLADAEEARQLRVSYSRSSYAKLECRCREFRRS
jgi:hypothetical protein